MLDDIHQIEERITYIDIELCKEEVYTNPQSIKDYNMEKLELQSKIDSLYEKWETLSLLIEEDN